MYSIDIRGVEHTQDTTHMLVENQTVFCTFVVESLRRHTVNRTCRPDYTTWCNDVILWADSIFLVHLEWCRIWLFCNIHRCRRQFSSEKCWDRDTDTEVTGLTPLELSTATYFLSFVCCRTIRQWCVQFVCENIHELLVLFEVISSWIHHTTLNQVVVIVCWCLIRSNYDGSCALSSFFHS